MYLIWVTHLKAIPNVDALLWFGSGLIAFEFRFLAKLLSRSHFNG